MREHSENNHTPNEISTDAESIEQESLLEAFVATTYHYFGSWQAIFREVTDPRNPDWIIYPIEALLCTGVLMFLFRLGSRRQIKHKLRSNGPSQSKFGTWFEVEEIPHGDTLNYGFKGLVADECHAPISRVLQTRDRGSHVPVFCPFTQV